MHENIPCCNIFKQPISKLCIYCHEKLFNAIQKICTSSYPELIKILN